VDNPVDNIVSITSVQEKNVEPASDLWADFWTLYPRHEAKKDAWKAWARLSDSEQVAAVVAASDWRQVWRAQGRELHVTPLPGTWLRGERWEDEIPPGLGPKGGDSLAGRHCTYTVGSPENVVTGAAHPKPRGEIPEHVKAMLAKLRAK
jgi:hypothetical protein